MTKLIPLTIILFCLSFFMSPCSANILRVPFNPDDPNSYPSLQNAIDASQNGDTILITTDIVDSAMSINSVDHYQGPVPKKDLWIKGESLVKIDANGAGSQVTTLYIPNADGMVLENLHFTNTKGFSLKILTSAPMLLNCRIDNSSIGIHITGLGTFLPNPFFLFNCDISNNETGVFQGIDKFVFLNSCFSDNNLGINIQKGVNANSIIANCIFKDNRQYAITIDHDLSNYCTGNFSNNVFDGNKKAGIIVWSRVVNSFLTDAKFYNNIFINNALQGDTSTYPHQGYAIYLDNPLGAGLKAVYTCFGIDNTKNKVNYNIGTDTNTTINADPKFANDVCDDHNNGYQLQPDSPCIDTGYVNWNDYDGSRSDMGARGGNLMNLSLNLYVTHSYWAISERGVSPTSPKLWYEKYRSAEYYDDGSSIWPPNGKYDLEPFTDTNKNGQWDPGEQFSDMYPFNNRYDREGFYDGFQDRPKNTRPTSTSTDWAYDGLTVWNQNAWNGDDTVCVGYYVMNPNTTTNVDIYFAINDKNSDRWFFLLLNDDGSYGASATVKKFRTFELAPNSVKYDRVVIPITKDVPAGEYRIGIFMAKSGTAVKTEEDLIGGIKFYPPQSTAYYNYFIVEHPEKDNYKQ
jgi:hypothetical protein